VTLPPRRSVTSDDTFKRTTVSADYDRYRSRFNAQTNERRFAWVRRDQF
jgi:hypothetical protein